MKIWTHESKTPQAETGAVTCIKATDVSVTTEVYKAGGEDWLKVTVWDNESQEPVEIICDYKIAGGFNQPTPIDIEYTELFSGEHKVA